MKDCPKCNKENPNDAEYCSCLYRFGEDETTALIEEDPSKKAVREERQRKFIIFCITIFMVPVIGIVLTAILKKTGMDSPALMISVGYLERFFSMFLIVWFANRLGYSIAISLLLSAIILVPYMFWFPFAVLFMKYASLQKVKPVASIIETK